MLIDPLSERALTGLEGFVTLVNDPTQIRAFYSLHQGPEDSAAMLSFEQTMLAVPGIRQRVGERHEPEPHDMHHTINGFGTGLPGEVGLSAVYLGGPNSA